MKTSAIFKKSTVVAAIIAIALMLAAITALAVELLSTENFVNVGEKAGVYVSDAGVIKLNFKYTEYGTADKIVVDVNGETTEYLVEDVKANGDVVSVPLAAAQMGENVNVYAVNEQGRSKGYNYSVEKYARALLAKGDNAKLRALVNYGAQAQSFFKDYGYAEVSTDGFYAKNTNALNGITANIIKAAYTSESATNAGAGFTYGGAEAVCGSETSLRVYFTYAGEGELTATVSRPAVNGSAAVVGAESKVKINNEKGSYVEITGIPSTLYATPYTVTVSDGTNTFTATKSVMDYIAYAVENGEANANVAKAMYQLYVLTSGVEIADCAHATKYYDVTKPATCTATGSATRKCTACMQAVATGKPELDTPTLPMHTLIANDNGTTHTISCSVCNTVVETKTVQAGVTYLGPEHFLNSDTLYSTLEAEDGVAYTHIVVNEKTAWQMFLNGASGASQNLAVGNAKYVVIKARADKNDVIKFSIGTATSGGRLAVGYTGAKYSTDWAIYVIDLSNHNNGTLGYLPNADGTYTIDTMFLGSWNSWTAGQYLDIAYMAFIEDLDSLKDLVTEYTYTLLGPGTVGAGSTNVAEEKNVQEGVTYLGPEHFNYNHTNMTSELKNENGMSYVRCTATKNTWQMFLNGASVTSQNLAVGNAKYVVIKARADKNDVIKFSIGTATSGGRLAVGYTGAQYSTDWAIYVIDLSNHNNGTLGYLPNADGTYTIDTMFLGSWNSWTAGQYLDIAYMAFIEDLDSLKDLVTEDAYTLLGPGTVGAGSTNVAEEKTIDREEDTEPEETQPAETDPAETDPVEGNVVELGPEHFNYNHSNMTSELKDENGMSYVRCTVTNNGAWMMFLNGASGASQNLAVGNAKYVVIKARADKDDNIKFSIDTATSEGRFGVGYTGAKYSTDWAIYVIDLSNHNNGTLGYLPNTDGTYTIDTMCLGSWNSWTAGQYLDIAYMAFIEDLDSLKDLVTEYTYTLLGPGTVGADRTNVAEEKTVQEGVTYLGPEHFKYNHSNMTSELKDENGMSYVRCTVTNNGAWMMFLNGASGASQNLAVGNAKYVVIKARADKNDVIKFSIDTATSGGRLAVGYTGAQYSTDWAIYVIDLSNHNDGTKGYLPNADGTYTIDTMCLGSWNQWTAGQYLDIAYMAFIEDLDSLKDLVTEDAYTLLGPGAVGDTSTNVAEEKTIDRAGN